MADDDYTRADRIYTGDARLERVTGAHRVISSDHGNIHAGEGFSVSNYAEGVADDAYLYVEFRTPADKYVHMKVMNALADGLALFEAVEAPTLTTGAAALTAHNLRRVATVPPCGCTIKSNPTSISGGTVIRSYFVGGGTGGNASGGDSSVDTEIVLATSTTYLFRVRNLAGSAKALSLWLFWYEEGGA